MLLQDVSPAGVAAQARQVVGEAPVPQHRIPALPAAGGGNDGAAVPRIVVGDQRVQRRRRDVRHVAKANDGGVRRIGRLECRPGAGGDRRAHAGRIVRVVGESAIQARERIAHPACFVAGHDDQAADCGAADRCRHAPDHRLAADRLQQLVACAHPRRLPGCQQDGVDDRFGFLRARRLAVAQHGPGADFLEQAADAETGDGLGIDGQAGGEPFEQPVGALFPGRTGRTRHGYDGGLSQPGQQGQIAGIDRQTEMLDGSAGCNDGCGDDVAPVRDGRCADHGNQVRSRGCLRKRIGKCVFAVFRRSDMGHGRTDPGEAFAGRTLGLRQQGRACVGQPGLDQRRGLGAVGGDRYRARRSIGHPFDVPGRSAEGDDLDGCDELVANHWR